MRTVPGGLVVVAMAAVTLTADGRQEPPPDAKKLVGKWEPKEVKKDLRTTIEFTKDGKVRVTVEPAGKKAVTVSGTYRVDGRKLKVRVDGREKDDELAIIRITDDEFESEDAMGKRETLVRVRAMN